MFRVLIISALCMGMLLGCDEEDSQAIDGFDEQEILDQRLEKDNTFRGDESPLPPSKRENFRGLPYYAPDAAFAVIATFEQFSTPDTITLQTSTNEPRRAIRAGRFLFDLEGKKLSLTAFRFLDGAEDSYFVPFTDNTSGSTTYKAGRYLDVAADSDNLTILDFNQAYNPYCAYSEAYSCPLVPSENNLPVSIRAGEKH